jgi:hypothetical protein
MVETESVQQQTTIDHTAVAEATTAVVVAVNVTATLAVAVAAVQWQGGSSNNGIMLADNSSNGTGRQQ